MVNKDTSLFKLLNGKLQKLLSTIAIYAELFYAQICQGHLLLLLVQETISLQMLLIGGLISHTAMPMKLLHKLYKSEGHLSKYLRIINYFLSL